MPDGLYTVPSDLPQPGGGWKMTINPGHFKRGQFMIWTLSTSGTFDQNGRRVGSGTSVGTYLVSGRAIPCHYRPAPQKEAPPPPAKKDGKSVFATDSGGYVTFADTDWRATKAGRGLDHERREVPPGRVPDLEEGGVDLRGDSRAGDHNRHGPSTAPAAA
ncbi:hypothetical protein AB0C21_27285 [Spirillospora sp. NPDC049024]